jgi:hypothetical protein
VNPTKASWLELLVEAEIVPADRLALLQCSQLIAILTTIAKKVKNRAK